MARVEEGAPDTAVSVDLGALDPLKRPDVRVDIGSWQCMQRSLVMSFDDSNLAIRRNKRRVIGVEGRLNVDADHSEFVKLTPSAPRSSDGSIPITAVDVSEGGIGILTACYLPRRTKCELILDNPCDKATPLFKAKMRVAQPRMVDRRPGYQLGLIFEESGTEFQSKLRDLIQLTGEM